MISIHGIISQKSTAVVAPSAGQTVKINCTVSNQLTSLPDWNNVLFNITDVALNNSAGVATNWRLSFSGGTISPDTFNAPVPENPDFPNDIARVEWYLQASNVVVTMIWTGLTAGKSYSIRTFSYDPGDVKTTVISWAGNTQSCNPNNNPTVLSFPAITADVNGQIAGYWTGGSDGGNPILNGIIIVENT